MVIERDFWHARLSFPSNKRHFVLHHHQSGLFPNSHILVNINEWSVTYIRSKSCINNAMYRQCCRIAWWKVWSCLTQSAITNGLRTLQSSCFSIKRIFLRKKSRNRRWLCVSLNIQVSWKCITLQVRCSKLWLGSIQLFLCQLWLDTIFD